MRYREEIDGLRAVAVLPVILFHAGVEVFSGGFVGVDVFFVISGYLITTIIISDLDNGKFSLARFYERRARRILPALFTVIGACIPFALWWFTPSDLKDFGQSIFAVTLFSSNILFWAESGYFGAANELKPLLHTWSLGVEEQYYILFPLLLMTLWRPRPLISVYLLAALLLSSLAFAHYAAGIWPSAAFFLLPTRGWELLIGSFVAIYLHRVQPDTGGVGLGGQALSFLGFASIFIAVFFFDEITRFPGFPALLPTLGTALIILFARRGTFVHAVLSFRAVVGMGLVSYSAYLWHQPLFAFARYRSLDEPGMPLMSVLVALSFALAYMSWRFIEAPFRNGASVSRTTLVRLSGVMAIVFISFGVSSHLTQGYRDLILAYRVDPRQAHLLEAVLAAQEDRAAQRMEDVGACRFRAHSPTEDFAARFEACADQHGPGLLVVGDSHAINLYQALARADVVPFLAGLARGGCRPAQHTRFCEDPEHYDVFRDFVAELGPRIEAVIYHQGGAYMVADGEGEVHSQRAFDTGEYRFDLDHAERTAAYLTSLGEATTARVIWIGPFLEYRYDIRDAMVSPLFQRVHPTSVEIFSELNSLLLNGFSDRPGFEYVDFGDLYQVPTQAFAGDCFLFRDSNHFSECGEAEIAAAPGTRDFLRQFQH